MSTAKLLTWGWDGAAVAHASTRRFRIILDRDLQPVFPVMNPQVAIADGEAAHLVPLHDSLPPTAWGEDVHAGGLRPSQVARDGAAPGDDPAWWVVVATVAVAVVALVLIFVGVAIGRLLGKP